MASSLITIGFFTAATLIGLALWSWILEKKRLDIFLWVFALITGTAVVTHLLFILSWVAHGLHPVLTIVTLSLLSLIAVFTLYKQRPQIILPKRSMHTTIVSLFFIVPIIFFFWIFKNLLFYDDGNLVAGWITVWGDWAAHMTYTTSFAYGQNMPPELPIFAGRVFSYPFMADFLSAILINLGVELTLSLILPSFIFTSSAFVLLARLLFAVTKKTMTAGLGTLLFFLNGGLGFVYVLFYGTNSTQLTKIPEELIEWMSVLTSQFIPQRGFALGFPIALVVFFNLFSIYTASKTDRPSSKLFFLNGLLIALLPLIHMHSFLMTMFVSGFVYLKTAKYIKQWLIMSLPILGLAIPTIIYFYSGSSMIEHFRLHLGWLAKTPADVPLFLLKNFGLMLLLPIVGWIVAPKSVKFATLPFWLIFVAANLFIFQPWDWDNTKFFVYWYVGAVLLAAIFFEKLLASRKPLLGVCATILFILSIYSGLSDAVLLADVEKNRIQMFSQEQLEVAQFVRDNTPPNSIFLNADNHDHLIPALAGRKTLLGYPGWLWSYGVAYHDRQSEIEAVKSGSERAQDLLKSYDVDYVLIGHQEENQGFDSKYFSENFRSTYKKGAYTLYQVK